MRPTTTMRATQDERDVRRADRWLTRSGGFGYVSPEAFELLQRRLRVRRRALWICSPFFVLAFALLVSLFWAIAEDESGPRFTGRYLLALGLPTAGIVLAKEIDRRADRRIGATLVRTVTSPGPVPLRPLFGRLRSAFLIIVTTVQATLVVTMLSVRPGWLASEYALGFAVAGALAGLGIRRAATRTTLAVDDVSLAIDERLRSEDAYAATNMLHLLVLSIPPFTWAGAFPRWFGIAWFASLFVVQGLWALGRERPPWKPVPPMASNWA